MVGAHIIAQLFTFFNRIDKMDTSIQSLNACLVTGFPKVLEFPHAKTKFVFRAVRELVFSESGS
jgi:hypothetical protein